MQISSIPKEKRFYEYLLELTKLTGKVIRDYRGFEKHWTPNDLKDVEGCNVGDELDDSDTFLEIQKPQIRREEKIPPYPNETIKEWLAFNINNENAFLNHETQKRYINEHGEESSEAFEDDEERVKLYHNFIIRWKEWSENLKEKKKLEKLYNEFFDLVSRFDREGESLELVFGRGILTWNHPDKKVGLIRSPLLTQKLELDLDAEKGVITASRIDEMNNVEREMLSGVRLPNKNRVDEILNSLKTFDIKDDITDLLTQFVHTIDANGEYKEPDEEMENRNTPVIYDDTIFIFRVKNTRVLRDDLENIIEGIDSGRIELNEAVKSILGEEVQFSPADSSEADTDADANNTFTKNQLFFPLESNEQQKDIVNRIERNYGVTVQGPPGTGKTHTIANLVSHFLAEGKRVLITSQKESPLRVLKSKIPKEIQGLCVPVLGGGRDSLQEIEKSINTISEKLGELDTDKLNKSVDLNLKELHESKQKEASLTNQLKDYAEKEGSVLKYKGEELFRYEVAKQLSETDINYEWLLDDLHMEAEFPMEEVEFKELWNLRDQLSTEDLKLYSKTLPKIDADLRNEQSFKALIDEGEKLSKNKDEGSKQLYALHLSYDITEIEKYIQSLNTILDFKHVIQDEGYKLLLNDLRAGGIREERWKDLVDSMEDNCNKLFKYYNGLVTHMVKLPEKGLSELKENIAIAKERIKSGKKPNFAFFLFKGKQTKYLFEDPILNDKPLSTIDDFKPIDDYIEYEELKAETARIINGNLNEINQYNIDPDAARFPHILEERLKELKTVIKVFEVMNEIDDKLSINHVDLYSVNDVSSLLADIKQAKAYLDYKEWPEVYHQELSNLKSFGNKDSTHSLIHDFISAFESENIIQWNYLLNHLLELYEVKKDVRRFYELLTKMNQILPLTEKSIEMSLGKVWEYPDCYLNSFELRKLRTWLDETRDINATKLRKLIENEKTNQRKLIQDIVRDASWESQIKRITEKEKRALNSWKTYIKRYGKATGKNKRYLSSIRESMKDAQSAIPVWIMPITQVLENFPITNDKFDVVIFDESSQSDIFSANVLLRGKRMIVVGDDEQISPQAIGVNQDDVNELVHRYLSDIPNSDLLDGNISLYEIAEQSFPKEGKLMLREHFRCVPEIIQFSNDLSYGGEMIPLRLPLEEEKIEPPVMAVKVNDGYNDEKDKDINLPEAEAIANDIFEVVNDSKYSNQTFGVITLQGNRQHKLLENLIRDKIGDAEYVSRKIICGNPYELQGDERDIIFLSMVVAPNRNFRKLTQPSEKQRYNVAASRAKNQMRLYHSVDTNELKSDDYRYALLSYSKNPTRINEELEDLEKLCDSPFEVDVLKLILAKGYKVTPQVKVGGYRIDLVIEGIRDRLAVECDGEKWHGPERFEEDKQRQASLERAGWKFWRIRGREFYFNRKKAMESLWAKLDDMRIEPHLDESSMDSNMERQTMIDNPEESSYEYQSIISYSNSEGSDNEKQMKLFEDDSVDTQQMKLFDIENASNSRNSNDSLTEYLVSKGLNIIDKRVKGGSLWVVGGSELEPTLKELTSKGIHFEYVPNGSRSTEKQPGWYMNPDK
ncbi:AAA domain-containing protein [Virgibacillus litoralis]|uniref:Superfamily I DNA and/or RNA helicase/very-short-patch-repair endonuclease n=1 Tax=Virgibacillus litoralis TaxID=578221 RepID=A0ABS4HID1_9BACI|nr:superfamily I DNA and/or RNA helicase/very-short-patch-repair endonuclease [Virgibacillus litoralis]